ncbi:MAG: hypothetical protein M3N93_01180 [Acidobacteriota bacterium]|nr:hypothetical protein [Acidobacteriota bacterium]
MRIIGRSALALPVVVFAMLAADHTPFVSLARIATALSANDSGGALEGFDSQMKSYPEIEQKLAALTEQADISCAIDVVTDVEADGAHKLDLDWYMQLQPQSDGGQLERRRERVQVEMRETKGVWKITSISPLSIFDPIRIQ